MLRKCATALAVSLVCLSGQALAQQSTAKVTGSAVATASTVKRVGAQSGESNAFDTASPWLLYLVFGAATILVIVAANDDYDGPVSP